MRYRREPLAMEMTSIPKETMSAGKGRSRRKRTDVRLTFSPTYEPMTMLLNHERRRRGISGKKPERFSAAEKKREPRIAGTGKRSFLNVKYPEAATKRTKRRFSMICADLRGK